MKVYATTKIEGTVTLLEWPSQSAFTKVEGWCDEKWINVATTNDLEGYEFPEKGGFIVHTEDQLASHALLHELYLKVQPKKKDVPYFMNIDNA